MRVLIAGSSGLIGQALVPRLREEGHTVSRLVRRETTAADELTWDPPAGRIANGALDGIDAVVNLCGSPLLAGRWSASRKQIITDSRIESTEVLAEAVAENGTATLVNASAVGYYGDTADTPAEESTPHGSGFLADLCVSWEQSARTAERAGSRVVLLRTGLVLSAYGGLLGTLKPLFGAALGGKLGTGRQFMPWISINDHIAAIKFVIETESLSGPVNLVAPNPVTNAEFTNSLARALRRPAPWWVPGFAMRALLGQAADEMALVSQRAVPVALANAGFWFMHNTIDDALAAVLAQQRSE